MAARTPAVGVVVIEDEVEAVKEAAARRAITTDLRCHSKSSLNAFMGE